MKPTLGIAASGSLALQGCKRTHTRRPTETHALTCKSLMSEPRKIMYSYTSAEGAICGPSSLRPSVPKERTCWSATFDSCVLMLYSVPSYRISDLEMRLMREPMYGTPPPVAMSAVTHSPAQPSRQQPRASAAAPEHAGELVPGRRPRCEASRARIRAGPLRMRPHARPRRPAKGWPSAEDSLLARLARGDASARWCPGACAAGAALRAARAGIAVARVARRARQRPSAAPATAPFQHCRRRADGRLPASPLRLTSRHVPAAPLRPQQQLSCRVEAD